jgi:thioredoxin-related protein
MMFFCPNLIALLNFHSDATGTELKEAKSKKSEHRQVLCLFSSKSCIICKSIGAI